MGSRRLLPFRRAAALTIGVLCTATQAGGTTVSPDVRARETVAKMTLDEKLSLVRGELGMAVPMPRVPKPSPSAIGSAGYVPGVPRLGIPALQETDAELGVTNPFNTRPGDVATALPSMLAIAASWDGDIAFAGGAMIGGEARAKGFNMLLAGAANLVREPRGGRNFEYPGEDPLLAGVIAGESIRGIQSNRIGSTIKHFAVNSQETDRDYMSADMPEAALRESDLLAFQIAIERGRPASVMCAYNRINGVPACEDRALLSDVLKRDWGYPGWVMSDWGAVRSTVASALAGLDQESAAVVDKQPFFGGPLAAALARGDVSQARIDNMAYRIVRSLYAIGVVDSPPRPIRIDYDTNRRIAGNVADQGLVLLRNQRRTLPLDATLRSIAVIGSHADKGVLTGGGSSLVRPVGGDAVEIKLDPASPLSDYMRIVYLPSSPLAAIRARAPAARVAFDPGTDIAAAVRAARQADVAIVFAHQPMLETMDAQHLSLPDSQDDLIRAVAAANRRTIVVLETGGAVTMPWIDDVAAVLAAWYPGADGGAAIARILFGDIDPAGRLPITFPRNEAQLPVRNSELDNTGQPIVRYVEGADVGYRWFVGRRQVPLYPFGFGMSYTRFAYDQVRMGRGKVAAVSFRVRNIGERSGYAVPQLYLANSPSCRSPIRRLLGWKKLYLKPGERRHISIPIEPRLLADFDSSTDQWRIGAGRYDLMLATSAIDELARVSTTLPFELLPAGEGIN